VIATDACLPSCHFVIVVRGACPDTEVIDSAHTANPIGMRVIAEVIELPS
jgi:hypothetical protein